MTVSEQAPQNYVIDLLALGAVTTIAIAETAVVYSDYFALPASLSAMGIILNLDSGGAIDVKVELEQGNTVPTANAADSSWAVGDEISAGITDTNTKVLVVQPIATKYARLKLTGQGSNHASTALARAEIGISKA